MTTPRLRPLTLGVLLGGWACGGGGAKPAAAPAPAAAPPAAGAVAPARLPLRAARIRGTELRFVEKGAGIPVVFVHGSLGTLESWQPQLDAFATRFRVIAYSRRYHWPNAAQPDAQDYSLSLHADDLIALIEALGLERVHLVGSSYGAYVALLATLRRPFDATVLGAARAAFARGDSVAAVQRFWEGMAGGQPASRFDALPEAARGRLLRLAPELRLETRAEPADYTPALDCKAVGGIRNPVLLVGGEKSPRMFHIIAEELARCLPTAESVTVPGAGHTVNADNPAYYNGVVLPFLLRH